MFWASPSTSGASRCTHSMKLSFLGSNLTLHSQQYLTTSTSLRQQQSGLHSSLGLPEVHHSSSVSTRKRDGYRCMSCNISLEHE
ncbi:Hypothetical protein FKW44_011279 [Caligus rogercresseyi]|uniref:Uncharacterized protein n=1 Tax=Caligus rogercresseyi TaxID=217165 RepID=A0A7T8HI78_CALRO|nr:Hypothetical protein FKW44_011279 [Caligus rogercresseyi]